MYELVERTHPLLRRAPVHVRPSQRTLAPVVRRMRITMTQHDGVGLAANQVGLDMQLFVAEHDGVRLAVANPAIEHRSDELRCEREGCLSLTGDWYDVTRSTQVILTGWDVDQGRARRWHLSGYLARIVQHEVDHLEGRCIDITGQRATEPSTTEPSTTEPSITEHPEGR
jgi:peptide deformylase